MSRFRTESLAIRRPALADRAAFAAWIADWRDDAYDAYRGVFARAWTDFDWYVWFCSRARTASAPELSVPLDVYWAFAGSLLAGELYVFREPMGGDNHIGYKVRPACRRTGVASALLAHGVTLLREHGIADVRLTCREVNIASAAVIERAGGKRLDDKLVAGDVFRRYVITTGGA